jgi:hypothetical protein
MDVAGVDIEAGESLVETGNFLEYLERGDWRSIISLSIGALICGFFWEMWNYYLWPKWVYHMPGTQFLHIFEMPLVGYGGYCPLPWRCLS